MRFGNIFLLLNPVLDARRSDSRIKVTDIDSLRDDIHELKNLLFFQLSWVLVFIHSIVERILKGVSKDEKGVKSFLYGAVGQRSFLSLSRKIYVVLQLVLGAVCDGISDGIQNVAPHFAPFSLEVIHEITL